MFRNLTWLPIGLAAVLVVAGCNSPNVRDGGAAPGSTAVASGSPAVGPSQSATPSVADGEEAASPDPVASVVLPEAGVLPRSLAYGILMWTVREAAITNQDPNRYAAGVPARPTAKTWLILDLDERNDNVVVGVIADNARLIVTLPDGTAVKGKNIEGVGIPPVSTAAGRYAFEVPAETGFDGLALTIADPGREPSLELPLDGPAPPPETNTSIQLGKSAKLKIPAIDMTWTIDTQITGRDWPLSLGFKGGTLPAGTRSEIGQRWLGLVARVQVGSCGCKGGVLNQAGSARLFVDGTPITAAATLSSQAILATQTISDVLLVFAVPAAATEATLQVGPLDTPAEQARISLDLD